MSKKCDGVESAPPRAATELNDWALGFCSARLQSGHARTAGLGALLPAPTLHGLTMLGSPHGPVTRGPKRRKADEETHPDQRRRGVHRDCGSSADSDTVTGTRN